MEKLFQKSIALILAIILISANLILLGEYTYAYALSNEELSEQDSKTNHKNVEFNSYFYGNSHSQTFDINGEDSKIYLNIKVNNAGYLENGIVEFQNTNFKLKDGIKNENIQSIDIANNKIYLSKLNNGSNVTIELPIEILKNDNVSLDYFNKETVTKFTGNYVDGEGEDKEISKEVINKLSWKGNAESEITAENTKYIPYATNGNYGVLVQTKVNSKIKDNLLPIKSTNININVPVINNTKPETVSVVATKTEATNGESNGLNFGNTNYSYNKETGMVSINTSNLADSISWKSNAIDEYLVTFIYEGKEIYDFAKASETGIKSDIDISANLTVYSSEEFNANISFNLPVEFAKQTGAITDFKVLAPSSISKGYIYNNYGTEQKTETEYSTKYTATVYSSKLVTELQFMQQYDKFLTEEEAVALTTVDNKNYAYNKKVEISQEIFNKILGEDGKITIKDEAGKELASINKDTELNNGIYSVDISKSNNNKLVIETTAPITEGQLEINVVKAIKGNIDYSKEQMKTFEKMQMELSGKTNTTTFTSTAQTLLKEPETKVELEVSKKDLTTVVKNENVEIRAVLDTSNEYYSLFKNPTLKITLPSHVKEVELNSTNILLNNGLKIKSSKVSEENGKKVINVVLEGTQTEYAINAEYKGAIVILNTDITLETLTPSGKDYIQLEYTNENDDTLKNKAVIKTEINYVAPTGVVAASGISGYKDGAEDILSISEEPQTVQIDTHADKRTVTFSGNLINNYPNNISNISILGRIPSQGNKKIDTDTELGSTFNMQLATGIGSSGVNSSNFKLYYSDNQNATKDLEDSNNGWYEQAKTTSKSFLIVFNSDFEMKQGDSFEFSYDADIPANLEFNNSAYGMYKVYYTNKSDIGNMEENKVSAVIGLTTGNGPELEVSLASTADVVREGQIVKMKVTVKNTGEIDATNAKLTIPVPKYAVFTNYVASGGFTDEQGDTKTIELGTIKSNETVQANYYIRFEDYITERVPIEGEDGTAATSPLPVDVSNTVTLTADKLTNGITSNDAKFTVQEGKISLQLVGNISENLILKEGQIIEYTIEVNNISAEGDLTNSVVTVPLPDGIKFKEAVIKDKFSDEGTTDGINYDENTNTVTFNTGTLAIRKIIIMEVEIEELNGEFSVMAKAKADNTEEHYSNITEYGAEKLNLEVSELTSTPRYIKEGDNVTYNLTITNSGRSMIDYMRVIDTLPEELTLVKATYSYSGVEHNVTTIKNGNVELPINKLAAGETVNISVVARAKLLPSKDDKEIQNKMRIVASNIETMETNTVTNIIEYNNEIHDENGGTTDPSNNRYKITGTAWLDENMDGKRDVTEQTLSNIQVILMNKDGSSIIKDPDTNQDKITTTSENGTYQFDNLENGEYLVIFVYDSSNYTLTDYQKDGVSESFNSDAIDINLNINGERRIAGITDVITINGGNARDIDIGLYTANRFDLRLDKYVSKVTLTTPTIGTTQYEYNSEVAKFEVLERNVGKSSAVIEYKIVVTNEGSVPGYVNKVVDYLPKEVSFNTELNPDWYLSENGNIYNAKLANEKINPGESKELTLVVSIKVTNDIIGTLNNSAEIHECYNELGLKDIDSTPANKDTSEDDMGKADTVVSIVTGSEIIIYTSIALVVIAVIGIGIYEIRKHVLNKKV